MIQDLYVVSEVSVPTYIGIALIVLVYTLQESLLSPLQIQKLNMEE